MTQQIISGQIKKNPSRHIDRALSPPPQCAEGIGQAPRHLTRAQKGIWAEIVSQAAPGTLQSGDRVTLEVACVLVNKFRSPRVNTKTITKPNGDVIKEESLDYMQTSELSLMVNTLSKLGLTPLDRSKIKTPEGAGQKEELDPLLAMSQIN